MADVCVLTVDGLPAVSLKPNEIYRIGKQVGFEICIADEVSLSGKCYNLTI